MSRNRPERNVEWSAAGMPTVVKIGGHVIDDAAALGGFLDAFAALPGAGLLVHGGGRAASRMAERLGLIPRMIEGRRVTDTAMLEVVTMVYGGLVNRTIVAGLGARGRPALGLTGADGGIIRARRRAVGEIDWGYVGDIEGVDGGRLAAFLDGGLTPVLAPLTADGAGQLLNTNADTIAAAVAAALAERSAVRLIYCFEHGGVLEDPADEASVIAELARTDYHDRKSSGAIGGGMIPKLDTGFAALAAGVAEVRIGAAGDLLELVAGRAGTRLVAD